MEQFLRFKKAVFEAQTIVISTHLFPDADGLGSQIALALALKKIGKNVFCINEEPVPERYLYLDTKKSIITAQEFLSSNHNNKIDLTIVVDTNSLDRVGKSVNDITRGSSILFIDHHPAPKELLPLHCIDTTMAATGEYIANIISALEIEMTVDMAQPLYAAILIDTNSFRYPSVTEHTHLTIAKLMSTGLRPSIEYNNIYGAKKRNQLQLLGILLSTAQTTEDHKIGWLTISEEMLKMYQVSPEDTHPFVNHLLILEKLEVACMFREQGKYVKVSLRSGGSADVGAMAQALGGGGHNHSAAILIEGPLEKVVNEMIAKLVLVLS